MRHFDNRFKSNMSPGMALIMISLALVYSSCTILLSEGSAVNQTNSTQNSSSVISHTPQTIQSSQASIYATPSISDHYSAAFTPSISDHYSFTPSISQSSSSLTSSIISSNSSLGANNSTVSTIEPSSTSVQASSSLSGDTLQMSANQGSSSGGQTRYVVLPPEEERRDFALSANTKLRWVRYLLDKSGPEFSVLKQFVEDHLNKIFKDVAGFIKTEVTEFVQEKVTFHAVIYTKIAEQVSKRDLDALLNAAKMSEKSNEVKIYAFEISPRFTEMPNNGNVAAPYSPPEGEQVEVVDGAKNFLQGFGAMFALILVFASIGFLKYKACNSKKKQDWDQNESLQEVHDNEVLE